MTGPEISGNFGDPKCAHFSLEQMVDGVADEVVLSRCGPIPRGGVVLVVLVGKVSRARANIAF